MKVAITDALKNAYALKVALATTIELMEGIVRKENLSLLTHILERAVNGFEFKVVVKPWSFLDRDDHEVYFTYTMKVHYREAGGAWKLAPIVKWKENGDSLLNGSRINSREIQFIELLVELMTPKL